ncbi:MAG: hypothetical protein FWC91_05600 [Defluviitaleaceae bacterium]|nr:hypothetical protein [Defluviitaleaceae bacterium]
MNSTESSKVVGGRANIKNNVKEQTQHFSWKLTFPRDVLVDNIPLDKIFIINENMRRIRCKFGIYSEENALLISPKTPYRPGHEYYFWTKYGRKEICVAFMVTENNQLQTQDQKVSMRKLNDLLQQKFGKPQQTLKIVEVEYGDDIESVIEEYDAEKVEDI